MAENNIAKEQSLSTFASHLNFDNGNLQTFNVDANEKHHHQLTNFFTWIDYSLFGVMLLLSALIGIYFGFFAKRKQNTTAQYMLGGRKMKFFPIAASLIASHINGFTMLAVPAEVYGHGSEYSLCVISAILTGIALIYVYLPVFYDLQVTSSFQYLELRFNRKVRLVASAIYVISGIIMTPTIIYVPALALSQVSGINLHIITICTSMICIFYTTIGGLKAVVYTDTLQFILMIGGLVCVIGLGLASTGGFEHVWHTADAGGRLIFFNMNPSPFVRTSFWTLTVGMTTAWVAKLGVSQCCIQRFLAVPNIEIAKKSVWVFAFGLGALKLGAILLGLIIYAKYENCDPVLNKQIDKIDQIVPLFVMDVASKFPGLPGLFIAGIFSAALSSISSILNTKSGIIYEDFIRPMMPNATEKRASDIMKILVVILGLIMLSLVFIVEHLGSIFRLNYAINGLTFGAFFGIFSIGMMSRNANTKGVIAGTIVSLVLVGIIIIGAQSLPKPPPLPSKLDGCESPFNSTMSAIHNYEDATRIALDKIESVPLIFRLSFMYYALLGTAILFIVALPVSWATGGCDKFDERLLTPLLRSKEWKEKDKINKLTIPSKIEDVEELRKISRRTS